MEHEARGPPVRTDMPVTDTGTIKAEATMQRATLLRDAPMKATVTWERVQLGNLTRLIYGEDRGWRGASGGQRAIQRHSRRAAFHHRRQAARLPPLRYLQRRRRQPQRHLLRRAERQRKPRSRTPSAACPSKVDCSPCKALCAASVLPATTLRSPPTTLAPEPC